MQDKRLQAKIYKTASRLASQLGRVQIVREHFILAQIRGCYPAFENQ